MSEQKYKCPECGWVGTESEMQADSQECQDDGVNNWSNWICPKCNFWPELDDEINAYEKINE